MGWHVRIMALGGFGMCESELALVWDGVAPYLWFVGMVVNQGLGGLGWCETVASLVGVGALRFCWWAGVMWFKCVGRLGSGESGPCAGSDCDWTGLAESEVLVNLHDLNQRPCASDSS